MELLFTGGRVLTMDGLDRIASGVAVRDGKIVAVGDSDEVRSAVSSDATHVDLRGRALTPGFCDPHNHFSMTTFEPRSVDCRVPPLSGKPAVLDALAAAAEAAPEGQWIWGLGYGARHANGGWLTRTELDDVAPNNPVCVMDFSYHASYANSEAMAIAGINFETPDPRGGQILRDESGEATGMLYERASDLVHHASMRAHIDTLGPEIVADLVEQNALRHLSHGVTSVGDAVVMPESAEMYRLADERGKLPIVIHQMRGGN
ncbi:MAG: amidohydrolase family protein, partial [Chloroflexi bacterium]|nr:amidohydrolase family protein [Chloroflexota bacterium]